jgi:hypothetical protein
VCPDHRGLEAVPADAKGAAVTAGVITVVGVVRVALRSHELLGLLKGAEGGSQ